MRVRDKRDEPMYRSICELILSCRARLVYTAGAPGLEVNSAKGSGVHFEACINEKAAFEMALAGAWTAKRAACVFSTAGVYEALDPLMSSAYMGVKGGFVIACVKEGALDVTPLGPFSKLPVLVSDGSPDGLSSTLSFAFDLSERYEIPCLVETLPPSEPFRRADEQATPAGRSAFVKDTARWAAIPQFRYELHKVLNEKIDRMREEFETYAGNVQILRGKSGLITHLACGKEAPKEDVSVLALGSVFPLPQRLVSTFIDAMEEVRVVEGPHAAIGLQVKQKGRIEGDSNSTPDTGGAGASKAREVLFGRNVVRDELGPASSINIAHGMVKSGTEGGILAVTDVEAFLHSGLPAFVNTLYNGSAYLLLIRTKGGPVGLEHIFRGFGFNRCFPIRTAGEIEGYQACTELTVLLFEGDL
jgi:TPP-dependent indolepyruvate ferredoxin oxidoreductase alpha subunit